MKSIVAFFLLFALCVMAVGRPRIVVDTSNLKKDSTNTRPEYFPPTDSTPARLVIDPGELAYQMQVDSVNQLTEDKIRGYITKLEKKFEDSTTEEEVGTLIGTAVMEQQMALLDLQVSRAISLKDTLLLRGLQLALQQLVNNSPAVQHQLDLIETELSKP